VSEPLHPSLLEFAEAFWRGQYLEENLTMSSFRNSIHFTVSAFLATAFLTSQPEPSLAAENSHWSYLASVSTYKPLAGFNHVVGPTRFVGYFLASPDHCRVTVFQAAANDEALLTPPTRAEISIGAGGRAELDAGDGSALAIACTVDADAIKIAPQRRLQSASRDEPARDSQ
jgi:hypothetical protein